MAKKRAKARAEKKSAMKSEPVKTNPLPKALPRSKSRAMKKKQMPAGVMIISILGYIFSIIMAIGAIALIIGGVFLISSPVLITLPAEVPAELVQIFNEFTGPIMLVLGILLLIIAVIGILISRGLWKLRNWARITVIVIVLISALSAFFSIIRGNLGEVLSLAIDVIIAAYLIFSENVKRAFS